MIDAWKIFIDWGKKDWINKTICYHWILVIDKMWEERIWEVPMASHSSLDLFFAPLCSNSVLTLTIASCITVLSFNYYAYHYINI